MSHRHELDADDAATLADWPLDNFTASAFPLLRFFSGGLNVNVGSPAMLALFILISRALLDLPCMERVLYIVRREQLENCIYPRLCCPGYERLRVEVHDCCADRLAR